MAANDEFEGILRYSQQVESRLRTESTVRVEKAHSLVSAFLCDAVSVRRGLEPTGLDKASLECLKYFIRGKAIRVYLEEDDALVRLERGDGGGWEVTQVEFRSRTLH